jgi:enolase
VECELTLASGEKFRAAVPSGASTGNLRLSLELRDNGKNRFGGKGCLQAVSNLNNIIGPALIGKSVSDQRELDEFMVQKLDGTQNEHGWCKAKLGANAILSVSLAVCRAGAAVFEMPLYEYIANLAGKPHTDKFILPVPSLNISNGGEHAGNGLEM